MQGRSSIKSLADGASVNLGSISELSGSRPSDMFGFNSEPPTYILMYGNNEFDAIEICTVAFKSIIRKIFKMKYDKMERFWVRCNVVDNNMERMTFDMRVMNDLIIHKNNEITRGR